MAIIAFVALIVIGPKDLPKTMKAVAHWMRKARSLTREFQSGIDEMVREAELEDARKALNETRRGNLERTISNAIDPDGAVGGEVKSVEREARRDGDAPAAGTGSNSERAAAKMVSQPANVAPPHSLAPATDKTATGDKADAKPASEDSKQSA